jgi:hypothetical protein
MKFIQDALYNWLTIKVVSDERPDDLAAVETERMFFQILEEDFGLADITVEKDDELYFVHYNKEGEHQSQRFSRELIEVMINQINQSPDRYKNYPE